MSYENQIRSRMSQLISWEQYRELLLEVLNASDYPGLETRIRSEFNEKYIDNPKLFAEFLDEVFSPHELVSRQLRSDAGISSSNSLLNNLLLINRTRNRVENGDFSNGATGWTVLSGANITVTDGALVTSNDPGDTLIAVQQSQPGLPIGSRSLIEVEVTDLTVMDASALNIHVGSANINTGSGEDQLDAQNIGVGIHKNVFTVSSDPIFFGLRAGSALADGSSFTFDNVKLRQLTVEGLSE